MLYITWSPLANLAQVRQLMEHECTNILKQPVICLYQSITLSMAVLEQGRSLLESRSLQEARTDRVCVCQCVHVRTCVCRLMHIIMYFCIEIAHFDHGPTVWTCPRQNSSTDTEVLSKQLAHSAPPRHIYAAS